MSTSTASVSRRGFLAGAAAAGAMGALAAGVAMADSVPPEDAMDKAKAVGTSTDAHGIPSADEHVIDIAKGVPKWGFEIAPEPIPDDQIAGTVEDDIIVIGAGMSGMCVAAAAAEQGAGVTLFAASSRPISRGGSNFSAYNKVIEECGIERLDPVNFFYRELKAASFSVDMQMRMRGYSNSEEAFNWLIDIVRGKDAEVFLERDDINDGGPDYAIAAPRAATRAARAPASRAPWRPWRPMPSRTAPPSCATSLQSGWSARTTTPVA